MTVATPHRTWDSADLATAVRDFHRVEIVGSAHIAPHGDVHVTDHGIMTHVGHPSIFNRATALDLAQFDVTLTEAEDFFDGLAHTLWVEPAEDSEIRDATQALLEARGYRVLPSAFGMATTSFPETVDHETPADHPDLLADPTRAPHIAEVTASGFGLGPEDRVLFEDVARAVLRHAKPWDHGAIYGVHGEGHRLLSVGSLLCTAEVAGIAGLATRPEHRGGGHASAILARTLHDARALGYGVAVSVANPDTRELLHAFDFDEVIEYRVFRWSGR